MAATWLTVLLYVGLMLVFGTFVFQWLWNITIPELFRLPKLRYWQALRLLLIAGSLFGSGRVISIALGR
jgi:hypothetical protein